MNFKQAIGDKSHLMKLTNCSPVHMHNMRNFFCWFLLVWWLPFCFKFVVCVLVTISECLGVSFCIAWWCSIFCKISKPLVHIVVISFFLNNVNSCWIVSNSSLQVLCHPVSEKGKTLKKQFWHSLPVSLVCFVTIIVMKPKLWIEHILAHQNVTFSIIDVSIGKLCARGTWEVC